MSHQFEQEMSVISEQEIVEGRTLSEVLLPEREEYVEYEKGELRSLLDRLLKWEAVRESGRTPERRGVNGLRKQTLAEVRESERLCRVVKARYVLARVWAETQGEVKMELAPSWQGGKAYWKLNHATVMTVEWNKANESRIYRIFRDVGGEWVEEEEYKGLAFPIETRNDSWRITDQELAHALAWQGKAVRQLVDWMEIQKKKILEEEEAQVCALYVLDMGEDKLGFISWYEDGEMSENQPVFEETEEEVAAWDGSCVDFERSRQFVQEVFEECDPEGRGFATSPKVGHGHTKIIESLRWLTGLAGRKGVVSLDWLTFEDREALILFAQASWADYKARRQAQSAQEEDWASLLA